MGTDEVINEAYNLGLAEKFVNAYNISLGVGVILALGILIYAGVRYAASGGNSSAISDARKWISAALVGLGLLLSTVLILNVINPDLRNIEDTFLGELDEIPPRSGRFLPSGYGSCSGNGGVVSQSVINETVETFCDETYRPRTDAVIGMYLTFELGLGDSGCSQRDIGTIKTAIEETCPSDATGTAPGDGETSGAPGGSSCFDNSECQSGICRFTDPNDPATGSCTVPSGPGSGEPGTSDVEITKDTVKSFTCTFPVVAISFDGRLFWESRADYVSKQDYDTRLISSSCPIGTSVTCLRNFISTELGELLTECNANNSLDYCKLQDQTPITDLPPQRYREVVEACFDKIPGTYYND